MWFNLFYLDWIFVKSVLNLILDDWSICYTHNNFVDVSVENLMSLWRHFVSVYAVHSVISKSLLSNKHVIIN